MKASIGGGTSLAGKRAAIVALEQTASRAAAQGGYVALKSAKVNIAAAIAEFGTEQLVGNIGLEDKRIEKGAGLAAGVATAAGVGFCVGGPAGAAAGAGI